MKLADFKDIHKGQRAFLVGTGPSLRKTPMDKLCGEVTFSLNNISDIFPYTKWRPKYFYNSTEQAMRFRGWYEKGNRGAQVAEWAFLSHRSKVEDAPNTLRFNYARYECPHCKDSIPKFSMDITHEVAHYRMSMWGMCQIAVFMGCDPLYFVGCDIGWKAASTEVKDPNHFVDSYAGDFYWTPYLARRENFYHHHAHKWLAKIFGELDIKAFNATIGGELEEYPRVDINDILR